MENTSMNSVVSSCMTRRAHKWADISNIFEKNVKDLKLGELLHDTLFGLFEAMSAIEMMDPKMDAGMLCNRGVRKIISFDQAVQDKLIRLDGLTESEIIGIIDGTLACLVSWLEGHSLAQTVFINVYLHKPYLIQDRVLRAFSLSVYKLLEMIKDLIHKAMVFEEEDFQPMQYGYHLNPEISDHRMIGMLREIEEELHKRLRVKQNEQSLQAVFARIKFIRIFLQILMCLKKEEQTTSTVDYHRLLQNCMDMLYIMQETMHLGVQDVEKIGFEPLINQRLLPPTFPRYTKVKSRVEAINFFLEMIERFRIIFKINNITALHQALDFFIEFSKTSPCILSRSALQLLYTGQNQAVLKDILRDSVRTFISPPALSSKALLNNLEAKQYIDVFLSQCTGPFSNYLQLCGHNRARQRDKLAHLLEEFTALQDEAERVDVYLHNLPMNLPLPRPNLACFGTWVLYHILRIMIMYLLTGFELELYSVHEYYYIYWYLYEFLYGWLISALSRAESFLVENEILNESNRNKFTGKKKSKCKKKIRPYNRDIIYLQALQNMCGGYYKALMGFRRENKLSMPNPRFDSEKVRYEHRFAPFQNLMTPPPVMYSEFTEMTSFERFRQQPVDSVFLYIAGCKHFHQARQLLETVPFDNEVNDLLRICKTNFVVLKLLAGGHKKDSNEPPQFDFSSNKYFPIIKFN